MSRLKITLLTMYYDAKDVVAIILDTLAFIAACGALIGIMVYFPWTLAVFGTTVWFAITYNSVPEEACDQSN